MSIGEQQRLSAEKLGNDYLWNNYAFVRRVLDMLTVLSLCKLNYLSIGVKYHAFISTNVLLIEPFVTLFNCRFCQKLDRRSSEVCILSLHNDYSALHLSLIHI